MSNTQILLLLLFQSPLHYRLKFLKLLFIYDTLIHCILYIVFGRSKISFAFWPTFFIPRIYYELSYESVVWASLLSMKHCLFIDDKWMPLVYNPVSCKGQFSLRYSLRSMSSSNFLPIKLTAMDWIEWYLVTGKSSNYCG